MDARPPVDLKRDTGKGFRPQVGLAARHVKSSLNIARLDGAFDRIQVRPGWARRLRREAYLRNTHGSTSIEGNPLDLGRVEQIARHHEEGGPLPSTPQELEIVRHYDWFRALEQKAHLELPDLTVDEVLETHRRLLEGVLSDTIVGRFRGPGLEREVYFGPFEGTPPARVEAEVEALLDWLNGPGRLLDVPVRVAVFAHEFVSIHPFADGNGRTKRALTHRLLVSEGLPGSLYVPLDRAFNEDRGAYYDALNAARRGRLSVWVDHFLRCLNETYRHAMLRFTRLGGLPSDLSGAQRAVVEFAILAGVSELQAGRVAQDTGYEPVTISIAFKALADAGVLRHNGRRGRGSAYHIDLEALDRRQAATSS